MPARRLTGVSGRRPRRIGGAHRSPETSAAARSRTREAKAASISPSVPAFRTASWTPFAWTASWAYRTKVSTRKLALHGALLDEGFLDYWRSLPLGGPLFPNGWLRRLPKAARRLGQAAKRGSAIAEGAHIESRRTAAAYLDVDVPSRMEKLQPDVAGAPILLSNIAFRQ
jgi:hypothetical protein